MADLPKKPPFDSPHQTPNPSAYNATDAQPTNPFDPRPSTLCDALPSSSATSIDFEQRVACPTTFAHHQQENHLSAEATTQEELDNQAGQPLSSSSSGGVTLHETADVAAASPVHFHSPLGRIAEFVHPSSTRAGAGTSTIAANNVQGVETGTYPNTIFHGRHQQLEPEVFRNQDTYGYPGTRIPDFRPSRDVFQASTYPHAPAFGSQSFIHPSSTSVHDLRPRPDAFHAPTYPFASAGGSQSYFPALPPNTASADDLHPRHDAFHAPTYPHASAGGSQSYFPALHPNPASVDDFRPQHDVFRASTYPHAPAFGSQSFIHPNTTSVHDLRPRHDAFHAPTYPYASAGGSQSYFPTIHPGTTSTLGDRHGPQSLLPLPALGSRSWNDHHFTVTGLANYDQIEVFRMRPIPSQLETSSSLNTSLLAAHNHAQGYQQIRPDSSVRDARIHPSPFAATSPQSDLPLVLAHSRDVDAIPGSSSSSSSSSSEDFVPQPISDVMEPPINPEQLRQIGENGDPGDFVAEAFMQAELSMRSVEECVDTLDNLVSQQATRTTEDTARSAEAAEDARRQGGDAARDARLQIRYAKGSYTQAFDETRVIWNRIVNDTRNIRRISRAASQVWEAVRRVRELEATLRRRERRIEHLEWEVAFLRNAGE